MPVPQPAKHAGRKRRKAVDPPAVDETTYKYWEGLSLAAMEDDKARAAFQSGALYLFDKNAPNNPKAGTLSPALTWTHTCSDVSGGQQECGHASGAASADACPRVCKRRHTQQPCREISPARGMRGFPCGCPPGSWNAGYPSP